jgi:hypothetical protein
MAATDTLKPGIRTGNFAPCRAGGFEGNHLTHSSFIPAKSASSRRMTVTLATRSREVPAALRMADTFFKHCLVCSWIVSPTIFPVTGSCGPVPETNTRPAARTAWLYVGGGDGASVVRMMSLATNFSSPEAEYLPAAEITRFPRYFCNGNGNGNGNVSCHCISVGIVRARIQSLTTKLQWSLEIAPSRVLGRNNKGSCPVNFFAAPKGERSHALTAGEGRCRPVPVGETTFKSASASSCAIKPPSQSTLL